MFSPLRTVLFLVLLPLCCLVLPLVGCTAGQIATTASILGAVAGQQLEMSRSLAHQSEVFQQQQIDRDQAFRDANPPRVIDPDAH